MDPNTRSLVMGAAGAGGEEKLYVEDVFSTYLYTGTGSAQTINNGIDLAGKGGLTWFKARSFAVSHRLFDTARGADSALDSSSTGANISGFFPDFFSGFTSSGFGFGNSESTALNSPGQNYVSWTFRKAPKFFDIVTYTGNGQGQSIPHNLGSTPGFIIIKRINSTGSWIAWHRSIPSQNLRLNTTDAAFNPDFRILSANSTTFTIGTNQDVDDGPGSSYVAYLFAHEAGGFGDSGNENIISCGSYTGNGSGSNATTEQANAPNINLGWEPELVIIKAASGIDEWWMFDSARGFTVNFNGPQRYLWANRSSAEGALQSFAYLKLTSTGFKITAANGAFFNENGRQYIYIAVRRGPMKKPTDATKVFSVVTNQNVGLGQTVTTGFPVDLHITASSRSASPNKTVEDRIRGIGPYDTSQISGLSPNLQTNTSIAETLNQFPWYYNAQSRTIQRGGNNTSSDPISWFFRRAPGFFDIVGYVGTGSNTSIVHNLGVEPELIIVKRRSAIDPWPVYVKSFANTFRLNSTDGDSFNFGTRFVTTPTASVFSVGTDSETNANGSTYVAYLFASCPGISKVGTYTGNGTGQDINCGFTNGARFVLIKQNSSATNWLVFDTARGIIAADDPYLSLNNDTAETTGDIIDPVNTGFRVPGVGLTNTNGAQYIFLAIA